MTNEKNETMEDALDRLVIENEREYQDWLESQANPMPAEDAPAPASMDDAIERELERIEAEQAQYEARSASGDVGHLGLSDQTTTDP